MTVIIPAALASFAWILIALLLILLWSKWK